jgi:hypothetical protein
VAVPLRIHVGLARDEAMPDLRLAAAGRAVFQLRRDRTVTGTMRLTGRCMEILEMMRAARWLTTGQIRRRFFGRASLDAARKRLRKLGGGEYIRRVQEKRGYEALFTLGREGKRAMEKKGAAEIILERQPPRQREHLLGINDVRIAAELAGSLSYFFSAWELPALKWRHAIIPDALFCMNGATFAVELDRGMEGIRYFVRTKIKVYERGLEGLPLAGLLVVADRPARMEALARAIHGTYLTVLFTTLDLVRRHGLNDPIFCRRPGGQLERVR